MPWSARCRLQSALRSWRSALTSTPTPARTCCRTSESGSSCRSGTGPSAARHSWPPCGSATRSACRSRRRRSPEPRSTTSPTPKLRTSSTRPVTSARGCSGRSTLMMSSGRCDRSPERTTAGAQSCDRNWSSHPRAVVLAVVALVALSGPPAAGAHLRSGTVAVDYAASVVRPDTSAHAGQNYQRDRALSLALNPSHVVGMLGSLGEPVFRLDAAGLSVNAASPTAAVVGLLRKGQRITASTPRWRLQRGRNSAVWHDARVQGLPPGVDQGAWSVPLTVDGRRASLDGELHRFPAPSLWVWLGMLAGLLTAGATPLLLRRGRVAGARRRRRPAPPPSAPALLGGVVVDHPSLRVRRLRLAGHVDRG